MRKKLLSHLQLSSLVKRAGKPARERLLASKEYRGGGGGWSGHSAGAPLVLAIGLPHRLYLWKWGCLLFFLCACTILEAGARKEGIQSCSNAPLMRKQELQAARVIGQEKKICCNVMLSLFMTQTTCDTLAIPPFWFSLISCDSVLKKLNILLFAYLLLPGSCGITMVHVIWCGRLARHPHDGSSFLG